MYDYFDCLEYVRIKLIEGKFNDAISNINKTLNLVPGNLDVYRRELINLRYLVGTLQSQHSLIYNLVNNLGREQWAQSQQKTR
jgi:hypothetical protein